MRRRCQLRRLGTCYFFGATTSAPYLGGLSELIKEVAAPEGSNVPAGANQNGSTQSNYSTNVLNMQGHTEGGAETLYERVRPLVELIQATNGLDEQQARTIVYYAIATHGLPNLDNFPILTICGPTGTGKTTLLEVLQQLAYGTPHMLIDGGKATYAALRDNLKPLTTALIDEADNVDEVLLISRNSTKTSHIPIKRAGKKGGWTDHVLNIFGATVLHRRKPFKDAAVLSRSIVIRTRKTAVDRYLAEEFTLYAEELRAIAEQVDWEQVAQRGGNRIADTWAPLLEVAALIGDSEWECYALQQMETATGDLDLGHEVEPVQAVYQSLLSLALDEHGKVEARVRMSEIPKVTAKKSP